MSAEERDILLSGLRAVDLSTERAYLCGKILGDFGVDVVKIEPPGGDSGRRIGPFAEDVFDPERSLSWLAHNVSKRGVTLDIASGRGREILKRLAQTSDFLIESFDPGYLDALGLDYPALAALNPRLIYVSVSDFGQTGPYSHFKACDMVDMAMAGIQTVTGDPERPPVVMALEQAYLQAGMQAATASLIAHFHRKRTGEGQHVDVSIREAALHLNYREPLSWRVENLKGHREGNYYYRGPLRSNQVWRCKDGYVAWIPMGGHWGAPERRALVEWLDTENMAGEMRDVDWPKVDLLEVGQEQWDRWDEIVQRFFEGHTKVELEEEAFRRGVRLNAIRDVADVLKAPQLEARGFWRDVAYPWLGTSLRYPARYFISNEVDAGVRFRAPRIGEHNKAVFQNELGMSVEELQGLADEHII